MVSEGTNKIYFSSSYNCPKCHWTNWVKPDDSFLKALVSERKLENIHYTELLVPQNEILRPFKILLTIPCEVCGEIITDWTEDKAKEFATGIGWAHEKCRKTLTGAMKQLGLVSKYIPKIEEKSSQQKEKEVGKQPVIKLYWPGLFNEK